MRFLADENLHADLVAWLRGGGHDVLYAAEVLPAEPDEVILRRARDEGRIVVTDDKDFGELVFHRRLSTAGVLLLRLRQPSIAARIARLKSVWPSIEGVVSGHLVVVNDRSVRARPLRPPGGG